MPKKIARSQTSFYKAVAGDTEYIFTVTPIPPVEDLARECGGIWNGSYVMVTLINYTRKTYFFTTDGPPLGWEYIAEKYCLDDDEAAGFTAILGKVLDREVRLPDEGYTERCLRVIPGGS